MVKNHNVNEEVKMLSKRDLVNSANQEEQQISEDIIRDFLLSAALQERASVIDYVENVGLHPDTTCGGKPTALCFALMKKNISMAKYFISKGADINHSDQMGMTPLHYAVLGGNVYCIAILISKGAKVNATTKSDKTPLEFTIGKRHLADCQIYLLEAGATLSLDAPIKVKYQ
ncbi:MAG: ankyrin repeat protein [Parvicella sp.]